MPKAGCTRTDTCGVDNDIVYIVKIPTVDDAGDSGWLTMRCLEVVVGIRSGRLRGVAVELEGLEKDGALSHWRSCSDPCPYSNARCGRRAQDLVDGQVYSQVIQHVSKPAQTNSFPQMR